MALGFQLARIVPQLKRTTMSMFLYSSVPRVHRLISMENPWSLLINQGKRSCPVFACESWASTT